MRAPAAVAAVVFGSAGVVAVLVGFALLGFLIDPPLLCDDDDGDGCGPGPSPGDYAVAVALIAAGGLGLAAAVAAVRVARTGAGTFGTLAAAALGTGALAALLWATAASA
jgi:hypothetical protein